MKLKNTENAIKNTIWGTINQSISIIAPFVIRTIIIYKLSIEYLGINSLFISFLGILNIAELGIGSAIGFSMYRPIAEDNTDDICVLLNLYRKCYAAIGIVILIIGTAAVPFLNYFVKEDCPPDLNLYLLYFIYLGDAVASYFIFAHKSAIFSSHQRESVLSKIKASVNIVLYLSQVLVLLLFENFYIYILLKPIATIISNILISNKASQEYPTYEARGTANKALRKSIEANVFALVGHKIGNTIINSLDNIVISAFLGLGMVGIFGNYYYILNFLVAFMSIWHNSMTAGIGNAMIVSDKINIYKNYNMLSLINTWLVSWCTVSLVCLYQPFMDLWVGKDNMLMLSTALLLGGYFYVWQARKIVLTYKDAAGLWNEDFWKPYIGALSNLIINVTLVKILGINGVVIASIFVMLIVYTPWEANVVFKKIFNISATVFWKRYITNFIVLLLAILPTYALTKLINGGTVFTFFIQCVICIVIPNLLFLLYFSTQDSFYDVRLKIVHILKKDKFT